MLSEFNFELSTPIMYDSGGEKVEASFIALKAPTKKQMQHNIALKEAFFKAVKNIDDGPGNPEASAKDTKPSGQDIIDMLYMGGIEMHKVLLSAIELFKSGVAQVEGTVNLTQPLIDTMTQDDLEAMTGEYIVNFTIASFLNRQASSPATS